MPKLLIKLLLFLTLPFIWTAIATALLIALAGSAAQGAEIWQWTEPASHHAAVVRVKTSPDARGGAYAGTGTVVAVDSGRERTTCLIVTAAHVVETANGGTITWVDGSQTEWRILQRDAQHDVAALLAWAPQQPPEPIPIAQAPPPADAAVEICGFGGPDRRLRHFGASLLTADETHVVANQYVISGDSGGAMLYRGELVGVVFGGSGQRGAVRGRDGSTWNLVYPASSRAGFYPIRRLLAQIWQPWMTEHAFPNYGASSCPGGRCPSPQAPGGPNLSPPPASPGRPPAGSVDYDRIVELVIERMACDERFRGPPGPKGDKGDAANIDIAALTIALTERMANDERFRGPQGPAGPAGSDASVDVDQLADDVLNRLPPITVNTVNGKGETIDSVTVGLGGYLNLWHKPIQAK